MQEADLSKYKGLYMAIIDDKVVTSGENAKQVLECKRKYPDKALTIAKIPQEETLVLVIE